MRDERDVMMKFVKIVQRHPEVYDSTVDSYKMRLAQNVAWSKITSSVKSELNEECTAYELKLKWKGIRSSFTRFLSKLQRADSSRPVKKYYLYDSLRFLDPFVTVKNASETVTSSDPVEGLPDQPGETVTTSQYLKEDIPSETCEESEVEDIKPDIINYELENNSETESGNEYTENQEYPEALEHKIFSPTPSKQMKFDNDDDRDTVLEENLDEENDLVLFFRSIVPDLRHFTLREKRKFKMGILGLVDVIEDDRRKNYNCNVVSSS